MVKLTRSNFDDIAGNNRLSLLVNTHFSTAGEEIVDLLLRMVVPRYLATVWFKHNVAKAEALSVNRGSASHYVC